MKNLIAIAALVAAVSTQAANIQWSLSTGAATIKAPGSTSALNGTAYLILANELSTIESKIAEGDSLSNIIDDYKLGEAALTAGKNTTTQTATSSKITAPTYYDFQVLIYDSASDKYYASTVKNQKAYDPLSSNEAYQIPTAITLGMNDVYATRGTTESTANWTDATGGIPEPATGALALAGIALLFKRRRA